MAIKLQAKTVTGWWVDSSLEIFHFPGNEPHVRDNKPSMLLDIQAQLAVVTRPTMDDLFALALWANLVRAMEQEAWIIMPYLPFARADRAWPAGAYIFAAYMNEIVEPARILGFDPHSSKITKELVNFIELDNVEIIRIATNDFNYSGIIAPDNGAQGRASRVGDAMGIPTFRAEKVRDFTTGKLSGFRMVDALPVGSGVRYLIVDDICDGGGTFVGLAEFIHKKNPSIVLDLWVSHGIFSGDMAKLFSQFDHIFTTDSWAHALTNINPARLHVTELDQFTYKEISRVK